jgi:hypothetical protein
MRTQNILALLLVFMAAIAVTVAQEEFSTQGDHFIFGYPPNFHGSSTAESYCLISITGDPGTTGYIDFYFENGTTSRRDFMIDQNGVYTRRYNRSIYSVEVENNASLYSSFEIRSDADVSVYAHNMSVYTSESMIVYPVNTLGVDYYIMSYQSLIRNTGFTQQWHPSQFLVVATEDNTTINLFYADNVDHSAELQQTITLDKNQSFLVESAFFEEGNDLTGSRVEADKPIAVMGSHNRAVVPTDGSASSYDYLLEMMPPKVTWAGEFYFVPFQQPNDQINANEPDIFRISPIFNDTEIRINNVLVDILDAGETLQLDLVDAGKVKATAPIIVAQYKKSNSDGSTNTRESDPFMMIVPPAEQYMESYQFYSVSDNRFPDHYITAIVPTADLGSVLLDGAAPNILDQGLIPNSDYSYFFVEVAPGVHDITADVPFGLYVYGYGPAESYGYIGGSAMRRIDNNPPVFAFTSEDECFVVEGVVEETNALDTYIERLEIERDRSENVNLNVNGITEDSFFFADSSASLPYRVELENNFADGRYRLTAFDRKDYKAVEEGTIKGFTVGTAVANATQNDLLAVEDFGFWDEDYTLEIEINNYGSFEQVVTAIQLQNHTDYVVMENFPITLQPGETRTVQIVIGGELDLALSDIITVSNDCLPRDIYTIDLEFITDTDDPTAVMNRGNCNIPSQITFSDLGARNRGLDDVRIVESSNIVIDIDESQAPEELNVTATVIDNRRDAFYTLEAIDGEGNTVTISDTISGFSVEIVPLEFLADDQTGQNNHGINENCGVLPLANTGLFPITLEYSDINNADVMIPPTSFPLTLQPGDTLLLPMCGSDSGISTDSIFAQLTLGNDCSEVVGDIIIPGTYFIGEEESDCDTELRLIQMDDLPLGGKIINSIYPVPAQDMITMRLILDTGNYTVTITDAFGVETELVSDNSPSLGIYTVEADISDFEAGFYFITVEQNEIIHSYPITKK